MASKHSRCRSCDWVTEFLFNAILGNFLSAILDIAILHNAQHCSERTSHLLFCTFPHLWQIFLIVCPFVIINSPYRLLLITKWQVSLTWADHFHRCRESWKTRCVSLVYSLIAAQYWVTTKDLELSYRQKFSYRISDWTFQSLCYLQSCCWEIRSMKLFIVNLICNIYKWR